MYHDALRCGSPKEGPVPLSQSHPRPALKKSRINAVTHEFASQALLHTLFYHCTVHCTCTGRILLTSLSAANLCLICQAGMRSHLAAAHSKSHGAPGNDYISSHPARTIGDLHT